MPPGKWTQEELDFLFETYPSLDWNVRQIADYLERSEHSVVKKASFLGLKKAKCSNVIVPEGQKICRTCKQIKPFELFYRNSTKNRAGDGYDSSCKACVSERERTRRQERKIKELEDRIAEQEIIPKEEFIRANQGKLFKCTKCNSEKYIEGYTVFLRHGKATRNSKCKVCTNETTRQRDLVRLRTKGYL